MHDRLEQLAARGHSVIVIANDEHAGGLIVLDDTVRANAKDALAALHRAGIKRIVSC